MKKNTIYNLDAISKYSIYSKFNINYDRILGDRSLKGFVKINKKPKLIKKLDYLEEMHQKYPKEARDKEKKDPHEFINQIIMKNSENNKSENKINNKYFKIFKSLPNEKTSIKNYFSSKKKFEDVVNLDPFKYHPNYNAIYKKIPYVRIVKPREKDQNDSSSKKKRNKYSSNTTSVASEALMINAKELDDNMNDSGPNTKRNTDKYILNKSSNINSVKLPIVNANRVVVRNNNHALRFSKYGNQRLYKSENKNEKEENGNQRYNNNSINIDKINMKKILSVNFDKMMSRKENDFVNYQSLETPSFNRYSPNYDFVKNSPAKISFSYHNMDNNGLNKKKYLLRKLMSSYNVDTEFHIVNTEKMKHNNSSNSIDKLK